MKHAKLLKNAAVISLGAIAAKGIGAFYRIPLAAILGGYGTGLYQMAYPLFVVLLTFSSTGIPSALARIVARDSANGCGGSVSNALRLFALLGLFGTVLMCLITPFMSALQGDSRLIPCYLALAPAVFLVSLIAVLRGYFQGRGEMAPTALSEIVEQIVKAGAGILLAGSASDPAEGAAKALFAVTLSEAAALLGLYVRYRGMRERKFLARESSGGTLLFSALPVMAATSLLPLSHMTDSILVVRLLSRYTDRAVTLYGLLAGGCATLASLPATLCYGLVAAIVPAVSRSFAEGEHGEGTARALYALLVTVLLSAPCAAGLIVFARPIVSLLFPRLTAQDTETLISLLRLSALSSVFLAGIDTLSAALTGMGRAKKAALSMLAAVTGKTALELLLVNGKLLVFGAAIAANACYTVAFFLDLFYTVRKEKEKAHDHGDRIGNRMRRGDRKSIGSGKRRGRSTRTHGDPRTGDADSGGYPL